jgi:hypothetical protein
MPLIGVEAGAASAVAGTAVAAIAAYLADRLGFAFAPFVIVPLSLVMAAAIFVALHRRATADRQALAGFTALVAATFGWLLWRARPDFLPAGTGPDLAHHLQLLAYIAQHGRLVHDLSAGVALGEMIDYTPGAHLLIAMAAAWLRTDALHAAHPFVALTVAVKIGIIFLIARRLLPDGVPRLPFAIVAALLPWVPYVFFAGSFMEQSFLPQVVSELFAVTMWWTVIEWRERPSAGAMALFALFGSAAFLTWPIWVGPPVLALGAVMISERGIDWRRRLVPFAIAVGPIALVTVTYAATRQAYGFRMATADGYAVWPGPHSLGWPFILLAAIGFVASAIDRRARSAAWLFAAIMLQAAALVVVSRSRGATAPYLALKMTYLAIYPLAVAAAVALARAWRAALSPAAAARYAWLPVVFVLLAVGRVVASVPRPAPVITEAVVLAGSWARVHLPPACVDYLVADSYTAYWLHLVALGNPRATGRTLDEDTFEPRKALVRWILPDSLPYAIAGDFDALPRDIRTNVDVLARFEPAAVVKRRGKATCVP